MAPLRSFGASTCDIWAAAEQLALVSCVYEDDEVHAQQLLGGSGQILDWVHRPDSWPPSYALIRSGAGRYFLVIAGTSNVSQFIGHIQGSFGVEYHGGPALVNGQWLAVWNQLRDDIGALLPPDPSTFTLHLSGHSYGGAVAQLGGIEWARDYGTDRAQVLTFGQPKVMTDGYTGPGPDVCWRVRSLQDVVGMSPPDENVWTLLTISPVTLFRSRPGPWRHYADDVWLSPDGTVGLNHFAPNPLPVDVATGPVSEHRLRNYLGRIRAHYLSAPGNPPDVATVLQITSDVLDGVPPQAVVPLPTTVAGLGPVPIVIPADDGTPLTFFAGPGDPHMAYPEAVVGGDIVKSQSFFVSKKQGWSESLLWHVTNSPDPLETVEYAVQKYHEARVKVLSDQCAIEGCRISVEGVAGDSILDEAPSLKMGSGNESGQPANAQECWLFKVQDASGFVRDSRPIRGLPQSLVNVAADGSPRGMSVPAKIATLRSSLEALLTVPLTAPAGGDFRAVLKTYERDPVDVPIYTVKAWTQDENGFLKLLIEGTAADLALNSYFMHWHDRAKCGAGVSGRMRVTEKAVSGTDTLISTSKKLRCPLAPGMLFNGRVQRVVPIYVPVAHVYGGHIGSHKVGAPFGATPGRRQNRC